jgi:uncharacterized repeat protein (TIGR03803 family)
MHSAKTSGAAKGRLNGSCVGPELGSTKLAAAIHRVLTLAVLSALLLITASPAQAQTETVLYNFTGGSDGGQPVAGLTSYGGSFYGTTQFGGLVSEGVGYGTVFDLSLNGSGGWNETVLYSFCPGGGYLCPDGYDPVGAVVFDSVGNLYGTTPQGGNSNCGLTSGCGVVFELSPAAGSWTESLPYTFCSQESCTETGDLPRGELVMDPEGNLYGTNTEGVFELSPSAGGWTFRVISFNVANPTSGLALDAAGNIFVVAPSGSTGKWTVYEVSPNGTGGWNSTVVYPFTIGPKGTFLWSALTLDQAGNLYGTETAWYNVKRKPLSFRGTVFKLSPGKSGWIKKVLFTFTPDNSATEGNAPTGGLVLDAAGNIYGTTIQGGAYGLGTVFELVLGAKGKYEEILLWSFTGTDGSGPQAGLILDSAGNLYGTTSAGGLYGDGVVFEITP